MRVFASVVAGSSAGSTQKAANRRLRRMADVMGLLFRAPLYRGPSRFVGSLATGTSVLGTRLP